MKFDLRPAPLDEVRTLCERYHGYQSAGGLAKGGGVNFAPLAAQQMCTRMLKRWEKAARKLGAARHLKMPSETRLDLQLAQEEREIVLFLYKQTFGHRIGSPKLPRPRIARR